MNILRHHETGLSLRQRMAYRFSSSTAKALALGALLSAVLTASAYPPGLFIGKSDIVGNHYVYDLTYNDMANSTIFNQDVFELQNVYPEEYLGVRYVRTSDGVTSAYLIYRFDFTCTGYLPTNMWVRDNVALFRVHTAQTTTVTTAWSLNGVDYYMLNQLQSPQAQDPSGIGSVKTNNIPLPGQPKVVFYRVLFTTPSSLQVDQNQWNRLESQTSADACFKVDFTMVDAPPEHTGAVPRVYDYVATLNTAVARNAPIVSFLDCEGHLVRLNDVCYRAKGNVAVKGVMVFGCNCVDEEELYRLDLCTRGAYPLVLMATSMDRFTEVVPACADLDILNRIGAPISSRARVAELGFDTHFWVGGGECGRWFDLWHAGFGTAGIIEDSDVYDVQAVSGNVVGKARAPVCSAQFNNCPRCVEDGTCELSLAFAPCTLDDCLTGFERILPKNGVAFGSFLLKYNKRLSDAIRTIPQEQYQETVNALVPLVFGKGAIIPLVEQAVVPFCASPAD